MSEPIDENTQRIICAFQKPMPLIGPQQPVGEDVLQIIDLLIKAAEQELPRHD